MDVENKEERLPCLPGAKGAAMPLNCMLNFPARMQICVDRASYPFIVLLDVFKLAELN